MSSEKRPDPTKKTGGELHTICPKPAKKILKVHKGLRKAAGTPIVKMSSEKIGLKDSRLKKSARY